MTIARSAIGQHPDNHVATFDYRRGWWGSLAAMHAEVAQLEQGGARRLLVRVGTWSPCSAENHDRADAILVCTRKHPPIRHVHAELLTDPELRAKAKRSAEIIRSAVTRREVADAEIRAQLAGVAELLDDADPELREMARAEYSDLVRELGEE